MGACCNNATDKELKEYQEKMDANMTSTVDKFKERKQSNFKLGMEHRKTDLFTEEQ